MTMAMMEMHMKYVEDQIQMSRSKQGELGEEKSRQLRGLAPCMRGISLDRIGMEGREILDCSAKTKDTSRI